jgi:GTP cyclohydrolase I
MAVNKEWLEDIGYELLLAIGENPERDGLKGTPDRFARWWKEFIEYDGGSTDALFDIKSDSIVAVSGIQVWSLCEHHLLPFQCDVTIGYIPKKQVLGLSKFARIAHKAAHKPQVQERLINEIADEITAITGSKDVAVIADGHHLCMSMRGIKTPSTMHTSEMRGKFRKLPETRNELMHLLKR